MFMWRFQHSTKLFQATVFLILLHSFECISYNGFTSQASSYPWARARHIMRTISDTDKNFGAEQTKNEEIHTTDLKRICEGGPYDLERMRTNYAKALNIDCDRIWGVRSSDLKQTTDETTTPANIYKNLQETKGMIPISIETRFVFDTVRKPLTRKSTFSKVQSS